MKHAPRKQPRHVAPAALFLVALLAAAFAANDGRAFDNRATDARATDTHASDAAKPFPFEPSEELVYQADFSKAIIRGLEIAEFRFTSGRAPVTENAHAPDASATQAQNLVFKSEARARGWFHKLFGLDFHYTQESVVDPANFLILRTTKLDEQGKRVRQSVAEFDRRADRFTWTLRNPNDPNSTPRVVTGTVRDAAHDFISAVYYLRTQRLAVGQSYDLAVSDDGRTYHVPVKITARRALSSVVGKVQALRLEVDLFGEGHLVDDRRGSMTVWITDDARHLPVRSHIETDFGTLDVKLKQVTGGIAGATRRR
ncbi:MAG: DUF3108 domain-containing protein [Acidobacteriota bacterium]|nr:DUF3108 domain-containing protein [Acidobacteriota bacterium]